MVGCSSSKVGRAFDSQSRVQSSWHSVGTKYQKKMFPAIGFFIVADTLESSSILIYSEIKAGLYTQETGLDTVLIKR